MTALDWNLHAVTHWAKMKSTTALKSELAVVYRLEGVGNSSTASVLLMGFLYSLFHFNDAILV